MKITRTSIITGIQRTLDLPITEQQFMDYQRGMLVQEAFSNLPADQREFILTGITKEEWDEHMKDDDDSIDIQY